MAVPYEPAGHVPEQELALLAPGPPIMNVPGAQAPVQDATEDIPCAVPYVPDGQLPEQAELEDAPDAVLNVPGRQRPEHEATELSP